MSLALIIAILAAGAIALVLAIILFAVAKGRRTQAVFFLILGLVLLVVGAGLGWQQWNPNTAQPLVATPKGPVQVRVLTALPVEPWVREAARQFNASDPTQDGQPIEVEVVAMDGLTALGKFDRDEFGALPATNARGTLGRGDPAAQHDLPDRLDPRQPLPGGAGQRGLQGAPGPRRLPDRRRISRAAHRHLAVRLGHLQSRAEVLEKKFGEIDWQAIHDAAIAKGGWPELGGDPAWGFFKLVVPNPRRNVGGLAAMIAAAGEYYDKTNISVGRRHRSRSSRRG